MDTSVGYRAFTLTNGKIQGGSLVLYTLFIVATKQKVVRNVRVMQLVKEVKYFLAEYTAEAACPGTDNLFRLSMASLASGLAGTRLSVWHWSYT